jgi:type II secretory pathway component PulF
MQVPVSLKRWWWLLLLVAASIILIIAIWQTQRRVQELDHRINTSTSKTN